MSQAVIELSTYVAEAKVVSLLTLSPLLPSAGITGACHPGLFLWE